MAYKISIYIYTWFGVMDGRVCVANIVHNLLVEFRKVWKDSFQSLGNIFIIFKANKSQSNSFDVN